MTRQGLTQFICFSLSTQGFKQNLHAVFCLAENAVGPIATRPDDVHTLYSGKTVEINNTDAEGRLVLGDGVAYARKNLKADWVVDMATLTGAQVRPVDCVRLVWHPSTLYLLLWGGGGQRREINSMEL